jgi:hypothetical protein
MGKYIVIFLSIGFFLVLALLSLPLHAEECFSPLQVGLFPPIQLVPKDKIICGIRLNPFWGENVEVWGLDAGFLNGAGKFNGIQVGPLNLVKKEVTGIQLGGINSAGNMSGIQLAVFENHADSQMRGMQVALLGNEDRGDLSGIQIGLLLNGVSGHVKGGQIGLINYCKYLTGFQIGLINVVYGGEGAIPFFPIINIGWY